MPEKFPEAFSQKSFEEQFTNKEIIEVAGGTAEVVDLIPEHEKSEVPILFAPSWGCTTEVYKPALQTLTEAERRVISLNHPRRGGEMEGRVPDDVADKYPKEELRKALNILDVLDEKEISKTDVIAHSEGAINTLIAASLHPEKFRSIVLFGPAGLIGKDTFSRLLKGFAGQSKHPKSLDARAAIEESDAWEEISVTLRAKEVGAAAAKEALNYILGNPLRSLRESLNIAGSDVYEMLSYLHKKGIKIIVMSGVDDPVFPIDKILAETERRRREGKEGLGKIVDGFLSLRGGHGQIGEHPERYVVAAEQMLSATAEKNT